MTTVRGGIPLVPSHDEVIDAAKKITKPWEDLFKEIVFRLNSLGREAIFILANNVSAPSDVVGLLFNSERVSQAIVEYIIQRVTTGTGAQELIESGIIILSYQPVSNKWRLKVVTDSYPSDSGVDFSVAPSQFVATYNHSTSTWTDSGVDIANGSAIKLQTFNSLPVGYLANTTYYVINTTGTTFKLSLTVGGSAVVATTDDGFGTINVIPNAKPGQVQYTSSNITGTPSISKISYRARILGAKSSTFSSAGVS